MRIFKLTVIGMAGLIGLYIAGPIVAGMTGTGDREGPVLYSEEFHTSLYIIGHEAVFQEKPRQRLDSWMYDRPLFYGMHRRLKPQAERDAHIAMAIRNRSLMVDQMIQMNQKANHASEATARKLAEPRR